MVQEPAAARGHVQELRVADLYRLFFIFIFFICYLPDCWMCRALRYDAMREGSALNWKSSWTGS
jgi:hypothetical protein